MTTTIPTADDGEMISVQFKATKALVERLDAECERLMIGRQIVLRRGAELMADHLARVVDPLANIEISSSTDKQPPFGSVSGDIERATRRMVDSPQA